MDKPNKPRPTRRSVSVEDEVEKKQRVMLSRTISMGVEKIPMTLYPRYQTTTPALLERWKASRNHRESCNKKDQESIMEAGSGGEESGEFTVMDGESPPVDEMVFFESLDDVSAEEELQVKIVKDQLRQILIDLMKSHAGNVHILEEIENGRATPEVIEKTFAESGRLEKNVALLWSAFTARRDVAEVLLGCGADLNYCEPHEGFSALHLSAFTGCTATTKFLISAGANVNYALKCYTPLHSAAFGNSAATAQLLLDSGARLDAVGMCNNNHCSSAIHSAIKANSVECVRLLARHCADINFIGPNGTAPIHLAAELGHFYCLQELLDVEGADPNVKTRDKKNTPLHLAVESGTSNCLALLLAKGADPDARNARGQTALHLAARAQSVECVETLLRTDGCDPNAVDNEMRTPLHSAVTRSVSSYDITEILIGWNADVNARDKYGYTPLHLAALAELSQSVECLIYHGADVTARTKGGSTALGIIVRKIPASLQMLYQKLDSSISLHDPEHSNKEVELKLDFRCILQHCQKGEISFLNTFIDEGQKEILEHPLCEAFLHLKWQKIRKYYIARLVFCGIFVLSLTSYVMSGLAWNCFNTSQKKNFTDVDDLCPSNSTLGSFIRQNVNIVRYQWYFLVFVTIIEVIRKLLGMAGHATIKQYFSQFENIFEWIVLASVFVIACVYNNKTEPWQNHVAAFAILCTWTNLMVMIGQLPLLGSYVAMYTKVQGEFAKLLLAYICMLVGFTFSFCVIFPGSDDFRDPIIGFIKVLVMMTGELDLELILKPEHPSSMLTFSAYVIFLVFILLVTVVLMNLLVGIAVNDIQGLKKTAGLAKLVRQTRLISFIEMAMFNGYIPAYILRLFRLTALVSPAAYRVVLHVKPLNPREKRLPKDTLQAAYELAKSRRQGSGGNTLSQRGSNVAYSTFNSRLRRNSVVYDSDRRHAAMRPMMPLPEGSEEMQTVRSEVQKNAAAMEKLCEEVREMREMLKANQTMMSGLLEAINKKCSNC